MDRQAGNSLRSVRGGFVNRPGILVVVALLVASVSSGEDSLAAPQGTPGTIAHGAVPVKIKKALDSSNLKEGDPVEVETTGAFKLPDGIFVSKGSKLTGHVATATARSKGDAESQLSIAFDKLNVAKGGQYSVKGTVQAVFQPKEEPEPMMAGKATANAGGSTTGVDVGTVTDAKIGSNMESSAKPEPDMTPQSSGVHGIGNLRLENGVLSSRRKSVKLGGGVRMIVRVDILG